MYVYIYIYKGKEREKERESKKYRLANILEFVRAIKKHFKDVFRSRCRRGFQYTTKYFSLGKKLECYVLTFDPAQKMLFQGDTPEGSDTFQWPVIGRDRVGGLRLIIYDKVKVPLCQYRLMHRKRVTSKLHDSYFRLMTIKHSISKIQWVIVWALNCYLTQLSLSPS